MFLSNFVNKADSRERAYIIRLVKMLPSAEPTLMQKGKFFQEKI